MNWTTEDKQYLLDLKHSLDSDNIKVKEIIKKLLLNNKYIIHVINNKELEQAEAEADEYYDTNIFPVLSVPFEQSASMNYICYEVQYARAFDQNTKKILQIVFNVVCESQNIIDAETGLARHDLLAALIQEQFNFTNYFGAKIVLVSDTPSTVDKIYSARTLVFEQIADNNLVKSKNRKPQTINKDVHTL